MRKKLYFNLGIIVLLLIAGSGLRLSSQTPLVTIDFPASGADNISRSPALKLSIQSPYKIDLSSMTPAIPDSLPLYDTVLQRLCYTQAFVIPSGVYMNNDSTLKLAMVLGAKAYLLATSDTTFELTPIYRLQYMSEYGVCIWGLRIYNPMTMDTIVVDTVVNSLFHTTLPIHKLVATSFDNSLLARCSDTLVTTFNRKLTGNSTALGDIIALRRITGTSAIDTVNFSFTSTIVTSATQLGSDSLSLQLIPSAPLIPGEKYYLDVNMAYLTGDEADNKSIAFAARQMASVSLSAKNEIGTSLPPECMPYLGETTYYLQTDEHLFVSTPKYPNTNFEFLHWECVNNPAINNNTSPDLDIALSCNQLDEYNLQAVYGRIILDTIRIIIPGGGVGTGGSSAMVKVTGYRDSLGYGYYTLPRVEGANLMLIVTPPTGYKFNSWTSSHPSLNGNNQPALMVKAFTNRGRLSPIRVDLTPISSLPSVDCSEVTFCVNIHYQDALEPGEDIRDMVTVNIPLDPGEANFAEGCTTIPIPLTPRPYTKTFSINLSVSDPCLEIAYMWDSDGGIKAGTEFTKSPDFPSGIPLGSSISANLSVSVPGLDCGNGLNVYIRKKRYLLTVEMEMEDLGQLPWNKKVDVKLAPQKTPKRDVNYLNPEKIMATGPDGKEYLQRVKVVYEFKCGEEVKAYPWTEANSGYEPLEWVCPTTLEPDLLCIPISSDPAPQTLDILMDNNYRIRHRFQSGFRVRTITFLDTTTGRENLFIDPPFDVDKGIPNDYANIAAMRMLRPAHPDNPGYLPRTTQVKIGFSQKVLESSLENGGLVAQDLGNQLYGSNNKRLDDREFTSYEYKSINSGSGNGWLVGVGDTVVLAFINSSGIEIPHMSPFIIRITDAIKSISNETLQNPFTLTKATEYPDISVRVQNLKLKQPDEDEDEVFVNVFAAISDKDEAGVPNTDKPVRFPGGQDTKKMKKDEIYSINNYEILFKRRMKYKDYIEWGYHAIDYDQGDAISKFNETIADVREKVNTIVPASWGIDSYLSTAASAFMVVEWIVGWLADDDETLDTGASRNHIYDNLWGAYPLYRTRTVKLDGSSIDLNFTRTLK